jgi:hypothetical protein
VAIKIWQKMKKKMAWDIQSSSSIVTQVHIHDKNISSCQGSLSRSNRIIDQKRVIFERNPGLLKEKVLFSLKNGAPEQ